MENDAISKAVQMIRRQGPEGILVALRALVKLYGITEDSAQRFVQQVEYGLQEIDWAQCTYCSGQTTTELRIPHSDDCVGVKLRKILTNLDK